MSLISKFSLLSIVSDWFYWEALNPVVPIWNISQEKRGILETWDLYGPGKNERSQTNVHVIIVQMDVTLNEV